MNCKIEIIPRLLHFKQPAGTSRGTYTTRKVWYLHFTSPDFPGRVGIGECAPFDLNIMQFYIRHILPPVLLSASQCLGGMAC